MGRLKWKTTARRADVHEMLEAADRAAALTRQLLAFSRRQVMAPKVINLNVVVSDIDRMLRRIIGEAMDLEISLDTAVGSILADPAQIEQVIVNLAVNARDAMSTGGRLLLQTANVDLDRVIAQANEDIGPGKYVTLTATDTGCGMSEETQLHIFEPFFTTS